MGIQKIVNAEIAKKRPAEYAEKIWPLFLATSAVLFAFFAVIAFDAFG
jgi:hypothetical protein